MFFCNITMTKYLWGITRLLQFMIMNVCEFFWFGVKPYNKMFLMDLFIQVLILLCSSTPSTYIIVFTWSIFYQNKYYLDGIFLLENPPNDFRGNVIYKVYWIHPVVRYRNGNIVRRRKESIYISERDMFSYLLNYWNIFLWVAG